MRCARCNRKLTSPVVLGGMAFGSTCARAVVGTKPKRARKAAPAVQADPRQLDLLEAA